jgi:LemA protein
MPSYNNAGLRLIIQWQEGGKVVGLIIVLVVVGFLLLVLVGIYNSLVRLRVKVKNAWAQVDVQLKRRHDLIPNLVETVKGYMKHERDVLTQVTEARTKAMGAQNLGERMKAEGELTALLGRLFAVWENYPQLRASENAMQLQEELSTTENKIAFSRQFYNDTVMKYNTRIQVFPSNIVASLFNFQPAEFFEIPEAEKEVPKVDLTT